MSETDTAALTAQFEANRSRLRALAYRMLGSAHEAEDLVQETWLRLNRAGAEGMDNLPGWLTTTVSRLALDRLRSRRAHREEPIEDVPLASSRMSPEQEAELADSIGVAMLVILDRLAPAERLAFVLHDTFSLSFDAIARILGRSPTACRQLASRARRRVRGGPPAASALSPQEFALRRRAVEAFSAAARAGDVAGLMAVLDPDAEFRTVGDPLPPGAARERRGALNIAKGAAYGARSNAGLNAVVLVNGQPGIISAPGGRLRAAAHFSFKGDRIAGIELLVSPADLRRLEIGLMPGTSEQ